MGVASEKWEQDDYQQIEGELVQLEAFQNIHEERHPNQVWERVEHHHDSWMNIFHELEPKTLTTHTISSATWYNYMARLESIFRLMQTEKSIDSEIDELLLLLLENSEKLPEKNFDFVLLVALQTYANEARLFYKIDKEKALQRLKRALEISIAAEDARSTAEDLGLEPIKLKKIDEFDDRPVYTL